MNPWHDVDPGKRAPEIVDCIIEVPRGCHNKYELDKKSGLLRLDRVLYSAVFYPANYGFIPRTYCDDHDPLDILVLGQEPVVPMCIVTARPIGVMQMVDENEEDDKIIAIHEHDPAFTHYRDISHLPEHSLNELRRFFEDYKALEHKKVRIERFIGRVDAQNVIAKSLRLYDASYDSDGAKRADAPILPSEQLKSAGPRRREPSRQMKIEAARRAAAHLHVEADQIEDPVQVAFDADVAAVAPQPLAQAIDDAEANNAAIAAAAIAAASEEVEPLASQNGLAGNVQNAEIAPPTQSSGARSTFEHLTIDARTLDAHAMRPHGVLGEIEQRTARPPSAMPSAIVTAASDTTAPTAEDSSAPPQSEDGPPAPQSSSISACGASSAGEGTAAGSPGT